MFSSFFSRHHRARIHRISGRSDTLRVGLGSIIFSALPIRIQNFLIEAGLSESGRDAVALRGLVGIIVIGFIGVFVSTSVGVLLLIALVGIAFLVFQARQHQRALGFEKDYPAFLLALRSSVRTGHDPLQAVEHAINLFPETSVVREELLKVIRSIEQGETEEHAIAQFAATIPHPDVALFRVGFLLSRQHGASLAPCLERLVRTTRQRQSFRRKISSAVAMQKLSSFGVAGCALFVPVMQMVTNPSDIVNAWNHPVGGAVLIGSAGLIVGGLIWMLSMTRQKV